MASEPIPTRLFVGQAPITTAGALFTADAKTRVTSIRVANVTASAATATLNLVPKGGSVAVANQITGAVAATGQSFTASTSTELLSPGILVLNPGDAIYGLAITGAADITFTICGDTYGDA